MKEEAKEICLPIRFVSSCLFFCFREIFRHGDRSLVQGHAKQKKLKIVMRQGPGVFKQYESV